MRILICLRTDFFNRVSPSAYVSWVASTCRTSCFHPQLRAISQGYLQLICTHNYSVKPLAWDILEPGRILYYCTHNAVFLGLAFAVFLQRLLVILNIFASLAYLELSG